MGGLDRTIAACYGRGAMDLLKQLIGYIRDPAQLINMTAYPYAVLALVVFLEMGAMVFFLPGDSLLVVAGLYAAANKLNIFYLNLFLIPPAAIGSATSYIIGKRMGTAIFTKPESRLFKPQHIKSAHAFYEKHGGKAIIIARFMPIVRTFVPVIAGVAQMPPKKYAGFALIGAAAWVLSMTLIGFLLGNVVPNIDKHIEKVIVIVVFISILPGLISWWKARSAGPNMPAAS
jgi:membrane-associated protein